MAMDENNEIRLNLDEESSSGSVFRVWQEQVMIP